MKEYLVCVTFFFSLFILKADKGMASHQAASDQFTVYYFLIGAKFYSLHMANGNINIS